jgi:predicted SAM-dependent methyltransferase
VRVNVGCGENKLAGYYNLDIKHGQPCFPLPYAAGSLDEIRASHVLEHLTFADASKAIEHWFELLKPGGIIRIAVPDVDKCLSQTNGKRLFYLMGGQLDEHDIHRSAYDAERLEALLESVGFAGVEEWVSTDNDCSTHVVTLNRMAVKPLQAERQTITVKVGAYITHPRYEAVTARNVIEGALKPLGIDLHCSQGVFWGQCMQRMFQDAIERGYDWILSIDSDSLFTTHHIRDLCAVFGQTQQADAMAALQCRRGAKYPLLTTGTGVENEQVEINGKPFRVTTAHFGLTLIRTASLKDIEKPWFYAQPDTNGEWNDNKLDDDIWFWHQFRKAGKQIYVAPSVSIGHLEETVVVFDEHLNAKHVYVHEWRKENGL